MVAALNVELIAPEVLELEREQRYVGRLGAGLCIENDIEASSSQRFGRAAKGIPTGQRL